ncbi:hypothetical protein AB5I41_23800 [Sphingomonas sp. MMS24-JH45]
MAIGAMTMGAAMAASAAASSAGQVTLPPVATTGALPAPAPVPSATTALPTLSAAQTKQLADLLAKDEIAQGLQQKANADLPTLDNDALVRAALDHARAVKVGRLAPEDQRIGASARAPTTRCPPSRRR